jgi:ATP phosphoribosyltransferase regulatory subunit
LPDDALRRRAVARALLTEIRLAGYRPVITPSLELLATLERGLDEGARRGVLKLVEPHSGELVAFRPDVTPQIARLAAVHLTGPAAPPPPHRLAYDGIVLRSRARTAGAPREVFQVGVELLGVRTPEADAEVVALAARAAARCGLDRLTIDVGHAAVVDAALRAAGVPADGAPAVLAALRRKDARGVEEAAPGGALAALADLYGPPAEVLARARALPALAGPLGPALDELEALCALLDDPRVVLDLGEPRAASYYTGPTFALYAPGAAEAVAAGGRYDDLVARYGAPLPATGFAADLDPILRALDAGGRVPAAPPPALLVGAPPGSHARALAVAARARARGVACAVDLVARDAAARAAYAAAHGFGAVVELAPAGDPDGDAAGDAARLDAALARATPSV